MNRALSDYVGSPFFQNFADQLSEYLYVVDETGRIVFINKAAEEFEKITREQVLGKHINDIYKQEESPTLKALETGKAVPEHENVYMLHGKELRELAKSFPILDNGQVIGAVTLQRDVTALNQILKDNLDFQKKMGDLGYPRKRVFSSLLGKDPAFLRCIELARAAAGNLSSVLLSGYTGSGKEMFAKSIHNESARKDQPFLAINCAAIPEGLLESLLFGTTKGSFTGAVDRAGLFEQAKGGTLFLDEINSMPLDSQAKLLRVLEEKELRRVGGSEDIKTDVRIISSINVLPSEVIARGQLREDLFYRLSVITITIPPLAQRQEDIDLMTDFFMKKFSLAFDKPIRPLSHEVYEFFHSYPWPGNVRQMKHVIESAVNISDPQNPEIRLSDLPQYLFENTRTVDYLAPGSPLHAADVAPEEQERETGFAGVADPGTYISPTGYAAEAPSLQSQPTAERPSAENVFDVIREQEKKKIIDALMISGGNVAKAARSLGMNRQTLVYRMKKYGISRL